MITHDGATWVFRDQEKYKDVIRYGKIIIKDNCFIGAVVFPKTRSTIHTEAYMKDKQKEVLRFLNTKGD